MTSSDVRLVTVPMPHDDEYEVQDRLIATANLVNVWLEDDVVTDKLDPIDKLNARHIGSIRSVQINRAGLICALQFRNQGLSSFDCGVQELPSEGAICRTVSKIASIGADRPTTLSKP